MAVFGHAVPKLPRLPEQFGMAAGGSGKRVLFPDFETRVKRKIPKQEREYTNYSKIRKWVACSPFAGGAKLRNAAVRERGRVLR